VLGERLAPAQLLGGALVLGAVVLLQLRPRPAAAPLRVAAAQANPGH
jgi:drug/metabolite transporter (DMT)-like permease